jgi:threonine dehydratase
MHSHTPDDLPDLEDIYLASARIRDRISETPVFHDPGLDERMGCQLYCKCENLQRTGSFKFRGASNAIACLRESGVDGDVATHSSGNHGAALALAASLDGRKAHVVMPENSVSMKIEAVRRYGGIVHFCPPGNATRERALAGLVESGLIPVPPFDHVDIMAGQGTAAMELIQKVPDLEMVITPAGGGGLVSGSAIACRERGIAVYAVEPEGAADIVAGIELGERVTSWPVDTIADGLRALVGVRNFAVISAEVKQVFTVSDEEIRRAMDLFWQETHLVIEPSSATVIAAISAQRDLFAGRKLGAIVSGGNIDPATWVEMTRKATEVNDSE